MKKFYLVAALGIMVFIMGCGQNKPSDMTSPDQITGNEEIIISNEEDDYIPSNSTDSTEATQLLLTQESTGGVNEVIEKPTDEQIQQALQNAGLYQGSVDGKIGPKSKRAIKAFQEQNGLTVDGKVGKKTWGKLAPYLNAAPAATTDEPMDD